MAEKKDQVSKVIAGLAPLDPQLLEAFKRKMNDEVIPEILKVVEERRVLAAKSRERQLKC